MSPPQIQKQNWQSVPQSAAVDLSVIGDFPTPGNIRAIDPAKLHLSRHVLSEVLGPGQSTNVIEVLNRTQAAFARHGDQHAASLVSQMLAGIHHVDQNGLTYFNMPPVTPPWSSQPTMPFFIPQRQLAEEYGLVVNAFGRAREEIVAPLIIADKVVEFRDRAGLDYRAFLHATPGTNTLAYGTTMPGGTIFVNTYNCRLGQPDGTDRTAATIANELASARMYNIGLHTEIDFGNNPIALPPPPFLDAKAQEGLRGMQFINSNQAIETISDDWSSRVQLKPEMDRLLKVYLNLAARESWMLETHRPTLARDPYRNSALIVKSAVESWERAHGQDGRLSEIFNRFAPASKETLQLESQGLRLSNPRRFNEAVSRNHAALEQSASTLLRELGAEGALHCQRVLRYYGESLQTEAARRVSAQDWSAVQLPSR